MQLIAQWEQSLGHRGEIDGATLRILDADDLCIYSKGFARGLSRIPAEERAKHEARGMREARDLIARYSIGV